MNGEVVNIPAGSAGQALGLSCALGQAELQGKVCYWGGRCNPVLFSEITNRNIQQLLPARDVPEVLCSPGCDSLRFPGMQGQTRAWDAPADTEGCWQSPAGFQVFGAIGC